MRILQTNELDQVNGGLTTPVAAGLTVGLMALAPASLLVITVGAIALAFYTANWVTR